MSSSENLLQTGYSAIPAGHLAAVVTCLEMLGKPEVQQPVFPAGITLSALDCDLARYRRLYRKVGEDWLWFSRIIMDDDKLAAILNDEAVEVYALRKDGEDIGILELDFRVPGQCELAFFGLASQVTGKGLGRLLMNQALVLAWSRPIHRLWVHTCTFDHPAALGFYIRSGFRPYAFQVEVAPDPRLSGYLPESVAPQIPLIPAD